MEGKDFIIPAKMVGELREKGVELIFKHGWVWDNNKEDPFEDFVLYRSENQYFHYRTLYNINKNFSETNPNKEQLEIGKLAYFWDDEEPIYVVSSELLNIYDYPYPYSAKIGNKYKHCSHKNPLEK